MNFRSKSNYLGARAEAPSHAGAGLLSTNWGYAQLSSACNVLEQRGYLFADDTLMNKDTRSAFATLPRSRTVKV